jgi:hypothetical protein
MHLNIMCVGIESTSIPLKILSHNLTHSHMKVADLTNECSPNNHNDTSQDRESEIGSIQRISFVRVKMILFMYSFLCIPTLSIAQSI